MAEPLPCPVCKRPVPITETERPATFPFCSARCRTIDLAAWATGAYVVAGQPVGQDQPFNRSDQPAP